MTRLGWIFVGVAMAGILSGSAVAANGPALPIDRAAGIAQAHLQERGLGDRVFISSLALEADSLAKRTKYWYARWSQSVPGEERKKEIGLRINMDGSLVRVIESPASAPRPHRTRSDRPSILDLK